MRSDQKYGARRFFSNLTRRLGANQIAYGVQVGDVLSSSTLNKTVESILYRNQKKMQKRRISQQFDQQLPECASLQ